MHKHQFLYFYILLIFVQNSNGKTKILFLKYMIKYNFSSYINLNFVKLNYILMAIKKFHNNFSIVYKHATIYTSLFVTVRLIIANQILWNPIPYKGLPIFGWKHTIGGTKNVATLYCFPQVSMLELQPW